MTLRTPLLSALAALAIAPLCNPSAPCRCQERPLSDYWSEADEVVIARFVGSTNGREPADIDTGAAPAERTDPASQRALRFQLTGAPHKTTRTGALRSGDIVSYVTAATSAECGIQGVEEGVYVLFARRGDGDDGAETFHVDSCSGSRVLLAPGMDQPGSFVDVPARFVMQQLNGLAGMEVLSRVVAHAPGPDAVAPTADDRAALLGLLDVSGFSHAGFARLYAEPDPDSELVVEVPAYDALVTRESGYEEPAAVVLARQGGWYRLRSTDGRSGWLPPDLAGTWFPYPEIALNRLNYIDAPWHGFVWPSPGAGLPVRAPDDPARREVAIEVLEQTDVGGFPWLRINVLSGSPCEVAEPRTVVSGWIPAWAPDGAPQVWYYSRGC